MKIKFHLFISGSLAGMVLLAGVSLAQTNGPAFPWPGGNRIAVSLSFDDARLSQVDVGTALIDEYGVKATFFVVPAQVKERLEGWKKATASGHEIGNHTLIHPCSGNYLWARQKALENYTLKQLRKEMVTANEEIESLLGVTPKVFAYPCGQTFVGRGKQTKSYIPLVAELFLVGRTYRDNIPTDPAFGDFAQLTGIDMDAKDFEDILPILERAKEKSLWVILGGHEIGTSGHQTTRLSMLIKLMEYSRDPANGIWIAPIGTVAEYIATTRKKGN